ncbi:hypothetical protein [Lysobacter capsici]|uniref:hypothetical protein n=1 Tax=Lysobacter capsici TaxID=435897 RepID=UPI001C00486E|nr:hypothetical protein [Lysobacter capsici]QWF16696.1 hypothetical protein KME82_23610 [Lysobacter capsici]
MHMDMNAFPDDARHDGSATELLFDDVESQVLDLANQAIGYLASEQPRQAAQHWARAIALADAGLPQDEIRFWLRSGVAEAYFQLGNDAACIHAAREARAWCLQQQAPLATLLLGQALLRSGQVDAALDALREARSLIGGDFFEALDPSLRETIADLLAQTRAA